MYLGKKLEDKLHQSVAFVGTVLKSPSIPKTFALQDYFISNISKHMIFTLQKNYYNFVFNMSFKFKSH